MRDLRDLGLVPRYSIIQESVQHNPHCKNPTVPLHKGVRSTAEFNILTITSELAYSQSVGLAVLRTPLWRGELDL